MSDPRAERHFDTEHLHADLRQRSVRGALVTLTAQGGKVVLSVGSTIVLARLLVPAEFGLVSMVAPIVGFVGLLKDLGLSAATIQQDRIDQDQVSTLFWINVATSVALAGLTMLAAPLIGWFYGESRVVGITLALGAMSVFGGLTAQHQALLQRQMRFTSLAAIELASQAAGVIAGVSCALAGWSYWALVMVQLVSAVTNLFTVWLLSGWLPGAPRAATRVRGMLRFGANLTGANVLNYLARNVDNVLIGRVWGDAAVGLYSRAYSMLLFPLLQVNLPLSRVAIPLLSRIQTEPPRYRQAYLHIVNHLMLLTTAGVLVAIVLPELVVSVLLGEQWLGAAEIFAWLGLAALIQPLTNTVGWLFITQGRTNDHFRWAMFSSVLTTAAIAGGLPWGPVGVAASYAVSGVLVRTPLLLFWVTRRGPIAFSDFLRALLPVFVTCALIVPALLALRRWVALEGLGGLLAAVALAYAVQALYVAAIPSRRREILVEIKRLLDRKKPKEDPAP